MPLPLLAVAAGMQAAGGIANLFAGEQQKAFQSAIADAQIQALQDQIKVQKIDAARRQRQTQGAGVVAAGGQGIQFSGSIVGATNQAIMEDQFKTLTNIAELKTRQRLTALGADAQAAQITQGQVGGLIQGFGGAAMTGAKGQQLASTLGALG